MALTLNSDGITVANLTSAAKGELKSGRKNLIINGGFDVWQRGTSFSGLSPYSYFADRWQCAEATTCARDIDVPTGEGFNYAAKMTIGSGGNALRMILEDSYRYLGSKNFTISFWAKASVANTGAIDVGDQQAQNIEYTTSWQKFTFNFTPINTTVHGGTANDYFDLSTGTGCDVWFTGVQLELGDTATDFEHRSYGEELALCQRYCIVHNAAYYARHVMFIQSKTTNTFYKWYPEFVVEMRATPTLIGKNFNSSNVQIFDYDSQASPTLSSVFIDESDTKHGFVNFLIAGTAESGGTGSVGAWRWNGTPDAYIGFDAEL